MADRFHVMKLVNEELNRARNIEKRAINELENEAKKEELQAVFNDSKYAVLKPEKQLQELQKLKLKEVKQAFPKLAEMHRQKESFRTIFEDAFILDRWSIQDARLALKMLRIHFGIVQLQ